MNPEPRGDGAGEDERLDRRQGRALASRRRRRGRVRSDLGGPRLRGPVLFEQVEGDVAPRGLARRGVLGLDAARQPALQRRQQEPAERRPVAQLEAFPGFGVDAGGFGGLTRLALRVVLCDQGGAVLRFESL